ncbi:MAG: hypothetical protein WC007_11490 [Pelobacteraceae bacterium]
MNKIFFAALSAVMILAVAGCGDGGYHNQPQLIVTTILSDPVFDGDIKKAPATGTFTVTQGNTQSVFAGIDPSSGAEYRAFLDFQLTGLGGVPGNAIIDSALLDIVINDIIPQPLIGTIPLRIDLVSFQPPDLIGSDFDRTLQPALASTTVNPPISQADFGRHITIDVTPLMMEAQRLGLLDFQIRIMEDLGLVSPGVIEINDTTGTNRNRLAPMLQVSYF